MELTVYYAPTGPDGTQVVGRLYENREARVFGHVLDTIAAWPDFAAAAGVPARIIDDCRERMPLLGQE